MTNRKKEVAKFFCGFEACHALVHAYLWTSNTPITAFGITATPPWSALSAAVNAMVALALGIYAWRGATDHQPG